MEQALLKAEGLCAWAPDKRQILHEVSLDVAPGECVCLAGESGCGKTTTLLSIAGLWPGRVSGRVLLSGRDLLTLGERQLCAVRGRELAMVFQDASAALNPVRRIGRQMEEALRVHNSLSRAQCQNRCLELLESVRLPADTELLKRYPYELSGGMAQRVVIAIALSCSPALILADEPTSALDEETGTQIAALLESLVRERGMGLLVATHQTQLFGRFADRTLRMAAGRIV